MVLTTPTINTFLADLPTTIAAYTVVNEDDDYTIIINSRLSNVKQYDAYEHELHHIKNHDFDKQNVEKIEMEAHGLTVPEQNPRPAWVDERLKQLQKNLHKLELELEEYEAALEPVRILWNEKDMIEHQKLGE